MQLFSSIYDFVCPKISPVFYKIVHFYVKDSGARAFICK